MHDHVSEITATAKNKATSRYVYYEKKLKVALVWIALRGSFRLGGNQKENKSAESNPSTAVQHYTNSRSGSSFFIYIEASCYAKC